MIRVKVDDGNRKAEFVEFLAIPLQQESDFRCSSPGLLSYNEAMQVAAELAEGKVHGQIAGKCWHRWVGKHERD